ncbi:MAG: hypothetical protein HY867_09505 [Chloroflexi bacterium]|nr:hypothetical protein [Chloroflexota bacterium]
MSDIYDIDFDKPQKKSAPKLSLWDLLSIVMLILTACIAGYYALIFASPNIALNPFAPRRLEASLPPTLVPTAIPASPTWTPSATPFIPPTDTPRPTFTPVFTPTLFSIITPSSTPKPSATPKAPYSASVQYIASNKYRPEFGCNWLGVAGIVLDKKGAHHIYVQVLLFGDLKGQPINNITVSGTAPQYYGASGFEMQLSETPVDTSKTLYLQLRDQGGIPLSENLYINTYSSCDKNMVFVTFKENK